MGRRRVVVEKGHAPGKAPGTSGTVKAVFGVSRKNLLPAGEADRRANRRELLHTARTDQSAAREYNHSADRAAARKQKIQQF